jgi:hypothetical protein
MDDSDLKVLVQLATTMWKSPCNLFSIPCLSACVASSLVILDCRMLIICVSVLQGLFRVKMHLFLLYFFCKPRIESRKKLLATILELGYQQQALQNTALNQMSYCQPYAT